MLVVDSCMSYCVGVLAAEWVSEAIAHEETEQEHRQYYCTDNQEQVVKLNASKQGCQDTREEVLALRIVTPEPYLNANPVPLCVAQDVKKHIDETLTHLYH